MFAEEKLILMLKIPEQDLVNPILGIVWGLIAMVIRCGN
jgi:hypothetical protein